MKKILSSVVAAGLIASSAFGFMPKTYEDAYKDCMDNKTNYGKVKDEAKIAYAKKKCEEYLSVPLETIVEYCVQDYSEYGVTKEQCEEAVYKKIGYSSNGLYKATIKGDNIVRYIDETDDGTIIGKPTGKKLKLNFVEMEIDALEPDSKKRKAKLKEEEEFVKTYNAVIKDFKESQNKE